MAIRDFYSDVDLKANQLLNSRLHNITTAARIALGLGLTTSSKGYMVYDTDLFSPYFWNGTQWLAAGGGGGAVWGAITGTLTAQTDLTAYLTANYYPLSSNPAGYLTSSALTPYLTSATAALTYEPIIAAGTTSQYWRGDKTWQTFPTIPAAQIQSDWNQTNNTLLDYIKNKPNIPIVGTWGALNYPTWTSGTPFVKMTAVGTFSLDTTLYQPLLTNPVTGTGTATRVAFWDTGSSISSDADLYWDNVNKRLGIGTVSPQYKLDVNGIIKSDSINFQNGVQTGIYGGANKYDFWAGNNKIATWGLASVGAVLYDHFMSWVYDATATGTSSAFRIASSLVSTAANSAGLNQLLIDPQYSQQTFGTGILRGIYYNPSGSVNTSTHIAWENTQGDIIHGNLATGGAAQMVTADSNGKLGIQTIPTGNAGTVTSVGLSMPTAFTVTNSPVTTSGTIAVTGAGVVSQYIRGDGSLANFPTSTGGGSSVSYYLNGSVSQGTIGGVAFREMNKTPIIGAGTDFTINADGYIQSFITDAGDPALLNIPAGNWNFEMWFSASSGGGSPKFYVELYKWNGTTLSLIATSSATPEGITNGTAIDLYTTALAVPATVLLATDRLAVRVYVIHSSKTITLHTEDSHLCEIITTFSTGLTALNGLTAQVQNFADDTNVTMVSSGSTHTITWAGTLADSRIASASTWNSKQNGRSVNVVSTNTNAGSSANTDYVYLVSGTTTITLPTAVGNTNRYTIKRSGTGVVSIATTSSQTIDDSASPITINVQYVSIDLISDGANWEII